jgi:hypothetical protein
MDYINKWAAYNSDREPARELSMSILKSIRHICIVYCKQLEELGHQDAMPQFIVHASIIRVYMGESGMLMPEYIIPEKEED